MEPQMCRNFESVQAKELGHQPCLLHQADWISGQLHSRWDTSDWNNSLKLGFDPAEERFPPWLTSQVQRCHVYRPSSPHPCKGCVITESRVKIYANDAHLWRLWKGGVSLLDRGI